MAGNVATVTAAIARLSPPAASGNQNRTLSSADSGGKEVATSGQTLPSNAPPAATFDYSQVVRQLDLRVVCVARSVLSRTASSLPSPT